MFNNSNTLVKVISLVLLLIFLGSLFLSGNISYYLHPRMYPFQIAGAVIILLMLISQFITPGGTVRLKRTYLFFLLPISCSLLFPPHSLEMTITKNRGIALENAGPPMTSISAQEEVPAEKQQNPDKLVVTGENFVESLNLLYDEMENLQGKKVSISGFIFDPGGLQSHEFVLARFYMTCCAADAGVIGLACQAENAVDFEKEQWYDLTGTVTKRELNGTWIPQLKITAGTPITKPENIYVY